MNLELDLRSFDFVVPEKLIKRACAADMLERAAQLAHRLIGFWLLVRCVAGSSKRRLCRCQCSRPPGTRSFPALDGESGQREPAIGRGLDSSPRSSRSLRLWERLSLPISGNCMKIQAFSAPVWALPVKKACFSK